MKEPCRPPGSGPALRQQLPVLLLVAAAQLVHSWPYYPKPVEVLSLGTLPAAAAAVHNWTDLVDYLAATAPFTPVRAQLHFGSSHPLYGTPPLELYMRSHTSDVRWVVITHVAAFRPWPWYQCTTAGCCSGHVQPRSALHSPC